LLVLALHALLLLGLWQLKAGPESDPAQAVVVPLMVWLPGAPPAVLGEVPERSALQPTARTGPPPRRSNAAALPEPPAITLPAAEAGPALPQAPPLPGPAFAPPKTSTPASAPLNLALPRGASAPWRGLNPALTDPRSNTPPPTVESGIAQALGGADKIEQFVMADGSVRFKRGNSCVIARPNRAGALDPFNASAQIRPRLLDRC
jgi:hypothetical protein